MLRNGSKLAVDTLCEYLCVPSVTKAVITARTGDQLGILSVWSRTDMRCRGNEKQSHVRVDSVSTADIASEPRDQLSACFPCQSVLQITFSRDRKQYYIHTRVKADQASFFIAWLFERLEITSTPDNVSGRSLFLWLWYTILFVISTHLHTISTH